MYKGEILLKRKDGHFKAGFCIVNKDLPDLIQETSILHPDEHAYYKTLQFDRRKTSYLLGRIAAKNAISELLITKQAVQSISIQSGIFQFPVVKYVQHQNIQVSISHCNNFGAALAFPEEHPLGIDIEKIDEHKIDTMKSVICDEELTLMENHFLPVLIACPIIWTIKESLSKILRTGLTIDFNILEIESIEKVGSMYVSTFRYFSQYKAFSCQIGDHVCSITLPKNTSSDLNHFWNAIANSCNIVN